MEKDALTPARSRLHSFLYLLLRDHMPAGRIEKVVLELEGVSDREVLLCNRGVAEYAAELERRLVAPLPGEGKTLDQRLDEKVAEALSSYLRVGEQPISGQGLAATKSAAAGPATELTPEQLDESRKICDYSVLEHGREHAHLFEPGRRYLRRSGEVSGPVEVYQAAGGGRYLRAGPGELLHLNGMAKSAGYEDPSDLMPGTARD